MNRRLWTGVVIVVGLLGGISFGFAPHPPTDWTGPVAKIAAAAVRGLNGISWTMIGSLVGLAGLVALTWRWLERRRRSTGHGPPWRTVVQLGKQGRPIAVIARDTGLSQDAVRILLSPMAVDPSFPRGNSFRSTRPPPPDSQFDDRSRRTQ